MVVKKSDQHQTPATPTAPLFLGIEGGATRTTAILADVEGQLRRRIEAGPGNLRLLSDAQLANLLRQIGAGLPKPIRVAIGMAGARTEADRQRIRAAAVKVWPAIPCYATNDLETALTAAEADAASSAAARVLVLSGTGSCCYGQNLAGDIVKVGGWGHLLGDQGSAYYIGLRALQRTIAEYDGTGVWPPLGQRLLRALELNDPNECIQWVQSAAKNEMAALATVVFEGEKAADRLAKTILTEAADCLVADAVSCARRLAAGKPVLFILAGGVLLKQPTFARRISGALRALWRKATVVPLRREGAWGAVKLAMNQGLALKGMASSPWPSPPGEERGSTRRVSVESESQGGRKSERGFVIHPKSIQAPGAEAAPPTLNLEKSPTEQRHPRSMNLDRLSLSKAIDLMLDEDAKIPKAILVEHRKLERAVRCITRALRQGGRLFYVGAGTSGRLGVLDASECPPTFSVETDMVQGIIAGGQTALWRSMEGAEDDPEAGAEALRFRGVTRKDVVVGIAASGRTPFVWGALQEAKKRGATAILLAFNPYLQVPAGPRPDLIITPDLGPEILTGSTRLKAGTATKLILNIFTTLTMVKLGKVVSNLMVDVKPSNIKLQDRAVRIVRQLAGVEEDAARQALERSGWVVKRALGRIRRDS